MDYNIVEKENEIIMQDMNSFDPKHIFECGQAFRWHKEKDNSYTAIHMGKIINVRKDETAIVFSNTNMEEFQKIWYDYFDLARDYTYIKEELIKDPILEKAIQFGNGIRILNQDPFETTISFIISANNQISRIRRSIELISKGYGKFIDSYRGKDYYSFPHASTLANGKEKELEELSRVGYRAKYILNSSKMICSGEVDLLKIFQLPTMEAKKELMKLPGVGPKVSDCILLFAFAKEEAFPVDVWVNRVMKYFYLKEETKLKDISLYANKKFGNLAGFAQQYLFYYAREHGIGRKK